MKAIQTPDDAVKFLMELQAPAALMRHAIIVMKTAQQILDCLNLPIDAVDSSLVLIGAVLHDVGKIQHPRELHEAGHEHEAAGYGLLLEHGFPRSIAVMCRAHAQWNQTDSLETLLVALADKLWKGKRVANLEDEIIKRAAALRQENFWSLYSAIQTCFDSIADTATERLIE